MEVEPTKVAATDTAVTVRNYYRSPGQTPIPVDYRMHQTASGWKVYDIVVDGVSLVMTYRPTFNEEIQRSGIDGLIKRLSERNRSNRAARLRK